MTHYIPMPRFLRLAVLAARLLPGISMLVIAAALLTIDASAGYVRWMEATYGINARSGGLFVTGAAALSLFWPLTSEGLRRAPLLDALGMGILTSPFWFFVGLVVYFSLFVARTGSITTPAIYSVAFLTQAVLYALTTGVRFWEMEMRQGAG